MGLMVCCCLELSLHEVWFWRPPDVQACLAVSLFAYLSFFSCLCLSVSLF